jgi:hypothetical protein
MPVTITRRVLGGSQGTLEAIQRRLKTGARDVKPVTEHFMRAFWASIFADFRVGGRSPFVWKSNTRNVVAVKGHGRPLIGPHGPKLRDAIKLTLVGNAASRTIYVTVPQVGEYHMNGWKGVEGGILYPKYAKALRFEVAEEQGEFLARRRKASQRRKAGERVRIPARPGTKVIFVKHAKSKGFPKRRFVVVREGLLREDWRAPLRAFLFFGVDPS